MRRKGQFLSLDALLSLVLVIMVIGIVINTNDMIKAEVSSMIGWYDRANIADNMLDVLTKSPGYPENWEDNSSSVRSVGLRSENYSYALSYEKITALNASISMANVRNSLVNFSRWKDFQMEFYLLTKNVSVGGSFPGKIYIDLSESRNRNIQIGEGSTGNNPFPATNVTLNGDSLTQRPQPYNLNPGDVLTFINLADITVHDTVNHEDYPIPANSYIEVHVIDRGSNFQAQWNSGELHITGQGQVRIIIQGNTAGSLSLTSNVIYPTNLTIPTYSFALINGSPVTSNSIINSSKARSPWIEHEKRGFVVSSLLYSNPTIISQNETKVLLEGKLKENVPEYAYLEIDVPSDEAGDITLVVLDGGTIKGVLIEKNASNSNVMGEIAWRDGNRTYAKFYEGNTSSVRIPWKDIFGRFNTENGAKPVELWIYENSFSGNVVLRDLDNLGMLLEPKFEPILIKLWVWDDR